MTVKGLLSYFENYYGEKYTGAVLDTMTEYLENSTEEYLLAVMKTMVKRVSRTYNKAPCVADIEKNMDEIELAMSSSSPKMALPEPLEKRASDEEYAEFMRQINAILNRPKNVAGPLNAPLKNIFDNISSPNGTVCGGK